MSASKWLFGNDKKMKKKNPTSTQSNSEIIKTKTLSLYNCSPGCILKNSHLSCIKRGGKKGRIPSSATTFPRESKRRHNHGPPPSGIPWGHARAYNNKHLSASRRNSASETSAIRRRRLIFLERGQLLGERSSRDFPTLRAKKKKKSSFFFPLQEFSSEIVEWMLALTFCGVVAALFTTRDVLVKKGNEWFFLSILFFVWNWISFFYHSKRWKNNF